jgi:4-carboxymuconolactone decarboxylase
MSNEPPEVLSEDRWPDREARKRDGQKMFHTVNTYPGPGSEYAYYDAGIIGFVFGELWHRGGLTKKERRWITLVGVGQSDTPGPILSHVYAAINSGDCSVEEVDEFNLFYATQLGWPKGAAISDALIKAQRRLEEEKGQVFRLPDIVPWTDPGPPTDRRARGKREYQEVMGEPPPVGATPFRGIGYLDFLYGENWNRPLLSVKDRRIIAVCCAAAVNAHKELQKHVHAAFSSGDITKAEMDELVLHHAVYVGWLNGSVLDDVVQEQWARVQNESPQKMSDPG